VKESLRARHVRLTLSLQDGLVVVVPKGFNRGQITDVLQKKRRWLEKASQRIEAQRKISESEPLLPERMALQGIGEEWTIEYRQKKSSRVTVVERPSYRLLVSGNTDKIETCRAALRRWLSRKAHAKLKPWLASLAKEHGFQFGRVLVRSQRTRWGSCSRRKTVSLNLKLLFMPEALLKHHEPDCKSKEKELRSAGRFVPAWIDAKKRCNRNARSWK
jgi:predicted metal-dependent hydrolase